MNKVIDVHVQVIKTENKKIMKLEFNYLVVDKIPKSDRTFTKPKSRVNK